MPSKPDAWTRFAAAAKSRDDALDVLDFDGLGVAAMHELAHA